jgi:hypothetical protein
MLLPRWLRRAKPAAPPPQAGFESLFGASAARRGTVLIIGNCLVTTMAQGLSGHPVTGAAFRFVGRPLNRAALDDAEFAQEVAEARHIFLQVTAADRLPSLRAAARPDAQFALFPDVVMRALWPFDPQNGHCDEAVLDTPDAVIRHPDGALAWLRVAEPNKARRFERYRALDFPAARSIDRLGAAQLRFLEGIDRTTPAGVGRFIAERFRHEPVFYNATHPAAPVFQALCAYVWDRLGETSPLPPLPDMDGWRSWSVPIHPGVARRLGVTWATETTRYHYATLGEVTWEAWVRAYIDRLG